ncbi:MAG: hypothetical protein ACR2QW_14950 [bacterium]
MNQEQFLNTIYANLYTGMKVLIPSRRTDILRIRESGDIVYRIADAYDKVLSRHELVMVYEHLEQGALNPPALRQIVSPSRTCNVSTIKWILSQFDLARETSDKAWVKSW